MAFLMFVVAAALTFAAATGFFAGKLVGMEQARREEGEGYDDGDCDFLAAGMGSGDPGRTKDAGSANERPGELDAAEGRTGCGLVVGKFLCRKIHIKNANRLNREERAELEQRTGLTIEQMQEYQGRRTGLRFWEVEQPEAVKPFPLKELGLGCPPMSWCRARRRKK